MKISNFFIFKRIFRYKIPTLYFITDKEPYVLWENGEFERSSFALNHIFNSYEFILIYKRSKNED